MQRRQHCATTAPRSPARCVTHLDMVPSPRLSKLPTTSSMNCAISRKSDDAEATWRSRSGTAMLPCPDESAIG